MVGELALVAGFGGGLSARARISITIGAPPLNCHLIVSGFRHNTADAVSVRLPQEKDGFGNHDNGIKAWVICPGFVNTAMGYVVPGANPASFLTVEEVVDVARYLLHTGDNVKLGPQILLRTMRNPMGD